MGKYDDEIGIVAYQAQNRVVRDKLLYDLKRTPQRPEREPYQIIINGYVPRHKERELNGYIYNLLKFLNETE